MRAVVYLPQKPRIFESRVLGDLVIATKTGKLICFTIRLKMAGFKKSSFRGLVVKNLENFQFCP